MALSKLDGASMKEQIVRKLHGNKSLHNKDLSASGGGRRQRLQNMFDPVAYEIPTEIDEYNTDSQRKALFKKLNDSVIFRRNSKALVRE